MALDLIIEEAAPKELYPASLRISRNFDELELAMEIDRLQEYFDAPAEDKPFGYHFEIDYGPGLLEVDKSIKDVWTNHYYDHHAQIWSSSHQEIRMFGVGTATPKNTYLGCGLWMIDPFTDDAC